MTRPSVLIFDLDGTLVESMVALANIFCDILSESHSISRELSQAVYIEMAGIGPLQQFKEVLRRADLTGDAQWMTEEFFRRGAFLAPASFDEVPEVLEKLRSDGYAMFVSSGGRTEFAQLRAERAEIDGCFRLILGTDEGVYRMAKGPGHFAIIAEALGIAVEELTARAWLIGDGAYDMHVAHEASIFAVGRLTGDNASKLKEAGANVLISNLRELLPLLQAA